MSTALMAWMPRPRRPWYCVSWSMRAWFAASSNGSRPTTIERRPRLHSKRSSISTSSRTTRAGASASPTPTQAVLVGHAHEHGLVAGVEIGRLAAGYERDGLYVYDTTWGHAGSPIRPGTSSHQLSNKAPGTSSGRLASLDRAGQAVGRGDARRLDGQAFASAVPGLHGGAEALFPEPQVRERGVVEAEVERQAVGSGDACRAGGEVAHDGELRGRRRQDREVFSRRAARPRLPGGRRRSVPLLPDDVASVERDRRSLGSEAAAEDQVLDDDERCRRGGVVADPRRRPHPPIAQLEPSLADEPVQLAAQQGTRLVLLDHGERRDRAGAMEAVPDAVDRARSARVRPEQLPSAVPRLLPRHRVDRARRQGRGAPGRLIQELDAAELERAGFGSSLGRDRERQVAVAQRDRHQPAFGSRGAASTSARV